MKKDKAIKELKELCRQYIEMARSLSLEDSHEREWTYGKSRWNHRSDRYCTTY